MPPHFNVNEEVVRSRRRCLGSRVSVFYIPFFFYIHTLSSISFSFLLERTCVHEDTHTAIFTIIPNEIYYNVSHVRARRLTHTHRHLIRFCFCCEMVTKAWCYFSLLLSFASFVYFSLNRRKNIETKSLSVSSRIQACTQVSCYECPCLGVYYNEVTELYIGWCSSLCV